MENKSVLERLDKIIGLLAIQGKEKGDQIKILDSLNFTSKFISRLTGIPEGTIGRIRSTKLKKK